jgi:predicted DsbA family dithiol-disulfide isomerase
MDTFSFRAHDFPMIKVEVWSDINCPFCYIGKKNLELALEKFPRAESVEVEWKSFELDPYSTPSKEVDNVELIARKYGRDRAWVEEMQARIADMGREAGIDFRLEKVVPANSFKAHKLLHLGKKYGIQNEMKEALLHAKFAEGKDIDDVATLVSIGKSQRLDESEIRDVMSSTQFDKEVREDEEAAARMGIRGVPFFVINQTEALSGAQPPEAFLDILESMD